YFRYYRYGTHRDLHSFPTRRSSDLSSGPQPSPHDRKSRRLQYWPHELSRALTSARKQTGCSPSFPVQEHASHSEKRFRLPRWMRSEEHTSELQSRENLVCRLLLEKK